MIIKHYLLAIFVVSLICIIGCKSEKRDIVEGERELTEEILSRTKFVKSDSLGYIDNGLKCYFVDQLYVANLGYFTECSQMFKTQNKKNGSSWAIFLIKIRKYKRADLIKRFILIDYLKNKYGLKAHNIFNDNTTVSSTMIQYKVNSIDINTVVWISGIFQISIEYSRSRSPGSLLNEYLLAFPPTGTFERADIETSSILACLMEIEFMSIRKHEEKRNWFNRYINRFAELNNMYTQCVQEEKIRAFIGRSVKEGCPISFIDGKEARLAAYDAFQIEAKTLPVQVDNIDWNNMQPKGGYNKKRIYQIAAHLGVPKFIIKIIEVSIDQISPPR